MGKLEGGNIMAVRKWAKCLVNTPGAYPDELKGKVGTAKNPVPGVKATHLITATDDLMKGYFYVDTTWLWSGAAKGPVGEPHTHAYSQVVGFIGGRPGAGQGADRESANGLARQTAAAT